jgi:RNA polymerase-binding transcription factor DksA
MLATNLEVIDMDDQRARALLEAEARRLGLIAHGSVGRGDGGLLDAPDAEADPVAAGADLLERELERAVGSGVDADRRAVADAMARLDAGTYGACEGCGRPIADERLEAVPATRFCVDHETWVETMLEAGGAEGTDLGRDPAELVRAEAQAHPEFLIDDDEVDDPLGELGTEERAVHVRNE